ncbi:hypothetical protein [Candidatus Hodarchaeum mangrovi]
MEGKHSFWDWLSERTNIPSISNTSYEKLNFRVSLLRNILQIIVFFSSIFLPWYRLYRPYGPIVIDAGPLQMRVEAIAFLLVSIIFSIIIIFRLLQTKKFNLRQIRILEYSNVFIVFLLLSIIANPVFLPGLGDRYTDFISLHTLNFAGYQVIPMLGYIAVLVGMASIIGGVIYSIFS